MDNAVLWAFLEELSRFEYAAKPVVFRPLGRPFFFVKQFLKLIEFQEARICETLMSIGLQPDRYG